MREWSKKRFVQLADRLANTMGFSFSFAATWGSFRRMLSLVEHCDLFVGNDSGPAFLAQCFGRPTFVIFGATRPDLILVSETAVGITSDVKCNGCLHFSRHAGIACASPICLETLSVDAAFRQIVERS